MIDIIIVNYNSTDYLINCLLSVKNSLNGLPVSIYIQDNASTDGVDIIRNKFPEVSLTKNSRNIGFAAAVNNALALGKNPFILLLNPDTTVSDNFFNECLSLMKKHAHVGIMGPKVLEKNGQLQHSGRSFPTLLTTLFGRTSILTRMFPNNSLTLKNLSCVNSNGRSPMEVDWVSGACMVVNRKAVEAVGGLDERFFLYWEDADWCQRMWESGWKVVYDPCVSICHITGASSKKELLRSVMEFHKSAFRLFEKRKHSLSVSLLQPFILFGLLVRSGMVLISRLARRE
ncbi:MAG: glycosyltransferase family 2 protein [Desulfobacterales bacterium]